MRMYKCEDCNLLMSVDLYECPICNSEKNKLIVDMDSEEEVVYKLTMEDVDYVLGDYDDDKKKYIEEHYSREDLVSIFSRKLEIEWTDYVEAVIDYRLLENYKNKNK